MAATEPPFTKLVPVGISDRQLLNACRVAAVNSHHPGAITYDPFTTLPPNGVSNRTILYAWYRAAVLGELQA